MQLKCSQTGKTSTLPFQSVEKGDEGHYKCLVKNRVQSSEMTSVESQPTVCKLAVEYYYNIEMLMLYCKLNI